MKSQVDIRGRGFKQRSSVAEFQNSITCQSKLLSPETVSVVESVGRVLAVDISSPTNVPNFRRSAMDGFALRGEETFGASEYNPLSFIIVGQIKPSQEFGRALLPGEAVEIMTGAALPEGADAVLMCEYAEKTGNQLLISEPVPPQKNVGRIGEDITSGDLILKKGRTLRPQDAAVLASVGIANVDVIKKPTVELLITGDEILPVGSTPSGLKIVDSNSMLLRSMVERDGGTIINITYLPDRKELIEEALKNSTADIVCMTGGTAVGVDDFAPTLVDELGELLVHGVAMRPASPTGFGTIGSKKAFLLPGNPVACMTAYDFFVRKCIRAIGGYSGKWPYPIKNMVLKTNIASPIGRVDYVRVAIAEGRVSLLATAGASVLSSTTRADGFVIIDEQSEGYAAGNKIDVYLYDL